MKKEMGKLYDPKAVEQKIVERLQPLGMPHVQFRVEISPELTRPLATLLGESCVKVK